jgi:hypothetical protein
MNIATAEGFLAKAVSGHVSGSHDALLDAVNEIGRPGNLSRLLTQLMADRNRLMACAARSYHHANNFLRLVLLAGSDPSWKLRLHLWWPDEQHRARRDEHIHNHRWDFATTLLEGSYRAQEFLPEGAMDMYRYMYFSAEGGRTFRLVPNGRGTVRQVQDTLFLQGSSYTISHRVMHRVISESDDLTATLFLQGPPCQGWTTVYADQPVNTQADGGVNTGEISPERIRAELRRYLRRSHALTAQSAGPAA